MQIGVPIQFVYPIMCLSEFTLALSPGTQVIKTDKIPFVYIYMYSTVHLHLTSNNHTHVYSIHGTWHMAHGTCVPRVSRMYFRCNVCTLCSHMYASTHLECKECSTLWP